MFLDIQMTACSKKKYYWLLFVAKKNKSYYNNFFSKAGNTYYITFRFYINEHIRWIVDMVENLDYNDLSKTVLVTAALFWKKEAFKILEKKTPATRESSRGLFFLVV
jgi:hypothetical protein